MIKKAFIFCITFNMTILCVDDAGEQPEQELVILRNSCVLPKKEVDSINIDLGYLQHYHDAAYDALCLALSVSANGIVESRDISLLRELFLIDEFNRIKDEVEMVLTARLLDSNSYNPSPYERTVFEQEFIPAENYALDR